MSTAKNMGFIEYWEFTDKFLIASEVKNKKMTKNILQSKVKCNSCSEISLGEMCLKIDGNSTIFFCPACNSEWLIHNK
jgi:hypothetical protein